MGGGPKVHRREFIASCGVGAAALLAACGPRAAAPSGHAQRPRGFDELVDGLAALSEELGELPAEEVVARAASLGRRVGPIELPTIDLSLYRDVIRTGVHHRARGIERPSSGLGERTALPGSRHGRRRRRRAEIAGAPARPVPGR